MVGTVDQERGMRGGSRALIGRTADEQPFTQDAAQKSKRRSRDRPWRILFRGSVLAGYGRRLFRPGFDWIDAGLYPMEAADADTAPPRVRLLPKIGRRRGEMGTDGIDRDAERG
jgi:hypothetical protein